MATEIIFLFIVLLGSILSSTFGIGSGIIIIPLASFILPIQYTIPLVAVYFITGATSKIIVFRKHIDWQPVLYIWLGAVPAVILGAILMTVTRAEILEKILAVIIILYCLSDYMKFKPNVPMKTIPLIGALYGFFGGIAGTGGVITAAFFNIIGQNKEKFIASMALSALLINIIKVIIYAKYKYLDLSQVYMFAGLAIVSFAGAYIGKRLVKLVSAELFRKAVILILFIISLKLLFF